MGMILIFFWGLYIAAAVGIYFLVKHFILNKWVHRIVLVFLILLPTYDIIITNALGAYYCNAEPNPKTFIKEKVEYPESIYWEDNIFRGFDAEDRKLMIVNYLDGVHLKTMALNGDDGKVYVYEANSSTWEKLKPLEKERGQSYYDMADTIVQNIMQTSEKSYTKQSMPKMNYTVTFNEVKLNIFARKFIYSDETKIIDNSTNETIAYNRQYIRFFYNIAPELSLGNRYYDSWDGKMCVSEDTQYFFINVFKKIHIDSGVTMEDFNSKLYSKYKKGEK